MEQYIAWSRETPIGEITKFYNLVREYDKVIIYSTGI